VEAARSLLDEIRPRAGSPHSGTAITGKGVALDYSGLAERVGALAGWLRNLAPQAVALHLDNGPDWIVVDLACQAAGIPLIPLPGFFSDAQLRHVLESMPVEAVFTDRADGLATLCAGRLRKGPDLAVGSGQLLRLEAARRPLALPPGTGKVTFTSGSTGRPKGVCLSNAQLLRQAGALVAAAGLERPRHLCLLPLSTLLENVAGVYAPLLAGGELIVHPLAEIGFTGSSTLNPQRLLNLLSRRRPESLILTPQLLQVLVGAARGGWSAPDTLRFVAVGGARVPTGLMDQAHALGIPAYEGYGLSECVSVVSLNTPGAARPGTCGRPLPHLQVVSEGGEIVVSGNAMLGYAGEPRGWGQDRIPTGDLGYLDEQGFLHVQGRSKNLLISSFGRNISPEWVESELSAEGLFSDLVVFGDAQPYCVALLSPRDPTLGDDDLQRAVERRNARLPDYARVLNWYRLPQPLAAAGDLLTDNGRPKRAAIEARYAEAIKTLYREGPRSNPDYARTA
jgi:long-subunit acyl-CoA synthetase (AMP-forming)